MRLDILHQATATESTLLFRTFGEVRHQSASDRCGMFMLPKVTASNSDFRIRSLLHAVSGDTLLSLVPPVSRWPDAKQKAWLP